ncbi:hypothetical protein ACQUW5_06730 [Legionella sp. CNM-1927-20]|uniref:hypothetical protein n=1 Tax=Legionella sp. CNM-1927-20 TaxID=3422221 RepID=UPI00403B11F6
MPEYIYKGFKVVYNIDTDESNNKLYKADGYVQCLLDKNNHPPQKFHTEYSTLAGVQEEIKKMLEDYIDFEWNEFNKMHD